MHAYDTADGTNGSTTDDAGLRPVRQAPASTVARVDAGEVPPSDVWHAIVTSDGFERALAGAVRELLADVPYYDRVGALLDAGVTAADGGYARLVAGLERAPEADAHERALELTAGIGRDGMTVLGHLALDELTDGPLAVFDAVDVTPTLAVRIGQDFQDRRRDQRERTLSLLARLGQVCEVRVVATGFMTRWLVHEHRDVLPATFSERCNAHHEPESPVDELVSEARADLDPDGRPVAVLRDLAEEPSGTLPYDELQASQSVSASRVSQVLGTLEDYHLAARAGQRSNKRVELRPAGSALLDALDAELGRQAELDGAFSDTGHSTPQAVLSRAREGPPTAGASPQQPAAEADGPYRTRWLARRDHVPAAAAATSGGITAVKAPIPPCDGPDDRHTRFVSYDQSADEAVIAVQATGPLQYMTSVALALASPRFFDQALPVDRLDDVDDPPAILRDARCIGALSSEAADDPEVLRDQLVEWGEDLAAMTTDLHHGEYDDRDRFRGEILRSAHGLAGSIVHLLDVVGVDVVRELRLSGYPSDETLAELAKTISISTAIQSKYGAFTVYRQVFEDREEKRRIALSPEVDATDPLGEYIGGLVVRGPRAHRLGQHLEGTLDRPKPVHQDAPEIVVDVPIMTPDRTTYAETVRRLCRFKSLQSTREAVTLFRTFTADPYAVAEALHWLGSEDRPRDVRLDEVRVALAHLDADQLLPDAPPTVSKALAALLRTATPLTQSDLADEAGVSTRSLRRHLDVLEALDVVREVDGGYRFALPDSEDERGQRILPDTVDDDLAAPQDLLYDVALALVEDGTRLADPDDPLGAAFAWPPDFEQLRAALSPIDPWVRVARTLSEAPDPGPATVTIGPDVDAPQTSLVAATGGPR